MYACSCIEWIIHLAYLSLTRRLRFAGVLGNPHVGWHERLCLTVHRITSWHEWRLLQHRVRNGEGLTRALGLWAKELSWGFAHVALVSKAKVQVFTLQTCPVTFSFLRRLLAVGWVSIHSAAAGCTRGDWLLAHEYLVSLVQRVLVLDVVRLMLLKSLDTHGAIKTLETQCVGIKRSHV